MLNLSVVILYSVLVSGMVTDGLKDAVGRPRPDFFWRCFPDGRAVYDDDVTTRSLCQGPKNLVDDGHKSFPSGRASCTIFHISFNPKNRLLIFFLKKK